MAYWTVNGDCIGSHARSDACGVAMGRAPGNFMVTDGVGRLVHVDDGLSTLTLASDPNWRWDNHLIAV